MENLELLREKYPPRKVENQMEFERIMNEMNAVQGNMNHPFIDRDDVLMRKLGEMELQRLQLITEMQKLKAERLENDRKRREINRVFHELKHNLIVLNPREDFIRKEECVE